MRRLAAFAVTLSLLTPVTAEAASMKCTKAGAVKKSGATFQVCTKVGKSLVWKTKAARPAPTTPQTPTVTPSAAPTPTAAVLHDPIAYASKVVAVPSASGAITAPAGLPTPPATANVRLFIADPAAPSRPLSGSGIFYQRTGADWKQQNAASDGTIFLTLEAGTYAVDVIERGPDQIRKRYTLTVDAQGTATSSLGTANASGYLAMTVDVQQSVGAAAEARRKALTALANEPASTFKPTSSCQLLDQVTANRSFNTDLSAGFPRVRTRLPAQGQLRALIVPLDFADQQGVGDPLPYFSALATKVRDFYYAQSYGRLAFDFEIVPNWVRMPFAASKYQMGDSVGSGDPRGYLKNVVDVTDPVIDYAQYDAVYFLLPKETPMSLFGWGPAITHPQWTRNGYFTNGATGGADMYYVEATGIVGGTWKWMTHETGHAFGLYDEDYKHESASLGNWGLMAMSWSNAAIELGAWDRYLLGWLNDAQTQCTNRTSITSAGSTFTIEPVVRQSAGAKSVMVPLSTSKILVVESRKSEGLDVLSDSEAGVIVYTVDMTIGQLGGGYRIVPKAGSRDPQFRDAALHVGDTVTVDGIKVTVESLGSTDVVRLQAV